MRTRILTLIAALALFITARAQYVTIPDQGFVNWLYNNGYSGCMSGNDLDTTCTDVTDAMNFVIDYYDTSIVNLDGVQYFDNLSYISILSSSIEYLNHLPDNVTYLSFDGGHQPLNLPSYFPPNLDYLKIGNSDIGTVPPLPASLYDLYLNGDSLTTLPLLPAGLVNFTCTDNSITSLPPTLPPSLQTLSVSVNPISALPNSLPSTLKYLYFGATNVSSLSFPSWPANLLSLSFTECPLATIPSLPNTLEVLECGSSGLTILPTLPPTLKVLKCNDTNISSLPPIPSTLTTLFAQRAPIGHLPQLPSFMQELTAGQCGLVSMVNFPDSVVECNISGNPDLKCFAPIGYIGTFYWGGAPECLPNYGRVGLAYPPLSGTPICDLFNTNNCQIISDISGKVYFDTNDNCNQDANDTILQNVKVELFSNGNIISHAYSDINGNYAFEVNNIGNYEIRVDTASLAFMVACPANGAYYDTLTILDTAAYNRNFALQCKPSFDLSVWSIATPDIFRPANNTTVNISTGDLSNYYNAHCATGISGRVTVTINGPASYVGSANGALSPSSAAGNVLTYHVADFGTIDALHDFNVIVQTDTFAQIGQQVCFTVNVTPTAGDNNPSNNTLTHCFTVVNSFDPNDKTAYPAGNIDTAQEWLTYTVRFQNTGNAEAQHIYIMDTLDTDIDAASFQLLAYSRQPNVQINEHIVRFNFPNINLPDSNTNEPGSHGYVQYKAKLKEESTIGTEIKNTAYIYFDFNAPVVTNTTTNTVALPEDTTIIGIKPIANELSLSVYPNPANQSLTVATNEPSNTIAIFNAQGRQMLKQTMTGSAETLHIAELASGIYYVEISSTKGVARKKFIKL